MIHLCPDLVTPQAPGEKERESGQFYEVFLYLNLFCTCKDDVNILQSIVRGIVGVAHAMAQIRQARLNIWIDL